MVGGLEEKRGVQRRSHPVGASGRVHLRRSRRRRSMNAHPFCSSCVVAGKLWSLTPFLLQEETIINARMDGLIWFGKFDLAGICVSFLRRYLFTFISHSRCSNVLA